MTKESTEVFAELNDVEYFHLQSFILQLWENAEGCIWGTCSSEPCGHEVSRDEDLVGPDRAEKIVQTGVSPFDKSVRSLFFGLWFGISLFGYVVLLAQRIKDVVDKEINDLYYGVFYRVEKCKRKSVEDHLDEISFSDCLKMRVGLEDIHFLEEIRGKS